MKYLFSFLIVFAFLISSASAQIEWLTSKSVESNISFDMPEKPFVQRKELNGITVEVFSYKDAVTVFGVVASNFSGVGLDFTHSDPTEYYKEMKEGSLVRGSTVLISENSVAFKRMLGKEIVYTQMVGKHEYTYFKRFFFRGKFIYQIAIGGPSRMKQLLIDKKNLFFSSIDFTE
ncbi:hypothetical protein L3049_10965 [Labilibaculum sp. DW002]|uniref:Uncharacterized protein n=1 Tax=Paralabilibaculum antarcticum TaxID=2912572 RepID=A0ABT5VW38_9BACT|nr:hypothetical protein [Labilibaculum sp. DW002]MDE5418529.1 hypothetical protein [Labilibaculum sp. DW002]